MKAVVDTNVLLVANSQHHDVSPGCVLECIGRLQTIMKSGVVVIDDGYRILGEYRKKTSLNPTRGVGDLFLKWLLQHSGTRSVEQVSLRENGPDSFVEFPDAELEASFDPSDRVFAAVANAHIDKPEIWEAADCKWIDWWPALRAKSIEVKFLCPEDACRFYEKKFPLKDAPEFPE